MIRVNNSNGSLFGGQIPASNEAKEQPASKFWLNIGYPSGVENENGTMTFVSLPKGIPLDNMEQCKISGKNQNFRDFQAAKNDLYALVMEAAAQLEPGEDKILNLKVQLFRKSEDIEPTATKDNPFAAKMAL